MIIVRNIPNPLRESGRGVKEIAYIANHTVEFFLKESGFIYENCHIIISGHHCKDLKEGVNNFEEIIITADIKDPVTAIVGVVGFVAGVFLATRSHSPIAPPPMPSPPPPPAPVRTHSQAMTTRQPAITKMPEIDSYIDRSPSYTFSGVTSVQQEGACIGLTFGEMKVGGVILNYYIKTDGKDTWLYVLIGLGEGEIKSIASHKINDQPIANFEGVTVEERMGTNDQTLIEGFELEHDLNDVNEELNKNDTRTYTTIAKNITGFVVHNNLPGGCYQYDSIGNSKAWTVTTKIEYKKVADVSWITLGTYSVTEKTHATISRQYDIEGLDAAQWMIRQTKTSNDSSSSPTKQGDLVWTYLDETTSNAFIYPNVALVAYKAIASPQLSNSMPKFTQTVKGLIVPAPDVKYLGSAIDWEDYYYDGTSEEYKRLSDDAVCTWDGTTFRDEWNGSFAWDMKFLMEHKRFGTGQHIVSTDMDLDLWIEISQYCENKVSDGAGGYEKRYRMDCNIDSPSGAIQLFMQLASNFGGMPIYSQDEIKLRMDKEDDSVQLFTMGSHKDEKFSMDWKSLKNMPHIVEAKFLNKDLDYTWDTASYRSKADIVTAIADGNPIVTKSYQFLTTSKSQATRECRKLQKIHMNLIQSMKLRVGISGVIAQAGQVISIQHDVPQFGLGGGRCRKQRAVDLYDIKPSAVHDVDDDQIQVFNDDYSLVRLDKYLTLAAGKIYNIIVQFRDDTREERVVTNVAGVTDEITVSVAFSQVPREYDEWTLGEDGSEKKDYRILGLSRTKNDEIDFNLLEMNNDVYDDSIFIVDDNNFSSLTTGVANVTGLTLIEDITLLSDGTIEEYIGVSFLKPNPVNSHINQYKKALIYLREEDTDAWVLRGETTEENFDIVGDMIDLLTYEVAVVSSDGQVSNSIDSSPSDTVLVKGKSAPPADVQDYDVSQEGNLLKHSWTANTDLDLSRYIIKRGNDWATGEFVAELVDSTEFISTVGQIGWQTYMCKAIDRSENPSTGFALDTINVTLPPEMNFINEFRLWQEDLSWKTSNVEKVWRNDYNNTYMRPVLALKTSKTWEELEAEGNTWEVAEAAGSLILDRPVEASGYYEMDDSFIDLEIIFDFNIIIDNDYKNVSGGAVAIQISHSEDNITWTAFATVDTSYSYHARYIKFKYLLSTTDSAYNMYLYDSIIYVNVPISKLDYGRDIAIPSGGKTIFFNGAFAYAPRINANIVNGVLGFLEITKTETSVFIRVWGDVAKTIPVSNAEIDFDAKGY